MGLTLPADVRESYRLHDGSRDEYGILPWGYFLLPLPCVLDSWRAWKAQLDREPRDAAPTEPKGPIRPVYWNPRWVPVSHNGGGDHQCIDLDPAAGGRAGQVIQFSHEVGPLCVLAAGFGQWLQGYARDLEAGRYRFDKDDFWVIPFVQE